MAWGVFDASDAGGPMGCVVRRVSGGIKRVVMPVIVLLVGYFEMSVFSGVLLVDVVLRAVQRGAKG